RLAQPHPRAALRQVHQHDPLAPVERHQLRLDPQSQTRMAAAMHFRLTIQRVTHAAILNEQAYPPRNHCPRRYAENAAMNAGGGARPRGRRAEANAAPAGCQAQPWKARPFSSSALSDPSLSWSNISNRAGIASRYISCVTWPSASGVIPTKAICAIGSRSATFTLSWPCETKPQPCSEKALYSSGLTLPSWLVSANAIRSIASCAPAGTAMAAMLAAAMRIAERIV